MTDWDRLATVNVVKDGGDVVITCEGAMDLHNSKDFHDLLIEASREADTILVDFMAVSY